MRISDWSSDVCSSDLVSAGVRRPAAPASEPAICDERFFPHDKQRNPMVSRGGVGTNPLRKQFPQHRELRRVPADDIGVRSEEHTSELQSLMRISYAVFCLTKHTINQYADFKPPTTTA